MADTARFLWLAEVLELEPDDRILEIGCGAGLAVEEVASKLDAGMITAIDRSQAMLAKALIRNARYVKRKIADFVLADLADFRMGSAYYNKAFAFNVNLFWTRRNIRKEADVIKSHLCRKGRLHLFYQPPGKEKVEMITRAVADNGSANGFDVVDTIYEKSVQSCCIILRPH